MRKTIIYSILAFALMGSGCSRIDISINQSSRPLSALKVTGAFNQTKAIHYDDNSFFRTEWEKGDTITLVVGEQYYFLVADEAGPSSSFSLSDEYDAEIDAFEGADIYAITGKVEIKDGNYALLKETMGNQYYNPQKPPLDYLTSKSTVKNGSVNLSFSYPCAYLRMKIKKEDIVSVGGKIVVAVMGDSPFMVSSSEDWVDEYYILNYYSYLYDTPPLKSGDNWASESGCYPYALFNLRWNHYICWYVEDGASCYWTKNSIFYHFPDESIASLNDSDEVSFCVAIRESSDTKLVSVSSPDDINTPLYEKVVPESGISVGNMYEVNLEKCYYSSDFSRDGELITLQQASVGRGIDIIIMAAGYTDNEMGADGLYEIAVKEAYEQLFKHEPYATYYRNRFNVYEVKVVSPSHYYTLDLDKVYNYERMAGFDDGSYGTIVLNRNAAKVPNEASTTTFFSASNQFVINMNHLTSYEPVLVHEFCHGMGKLADEYYYGDEVARELTQEEIESLCNNHNSGRFMNIDTENNPDKVIWSHILKDDRFIGESLGIFEGPIMNYTTGVYRSSEYSLMNAGYTGPFDMVWLNAPSREALYKWIMSLSEGPEWQYDYESFVEFDRPYRELFYNKQNAIVPRKNDRVLHASPVYGGESLKHHLPVSEIH